MKKLYRFTAAAGIMLLCAGCSLVVSGPEQKLYKALQTGNCQGVREVLKDEKDIDLEHISYSDDDAKGEAPALILAARSEYKMPEIIKELIQAGADVNGTDSENITGLMYGIGNADICRMLLDAGADVNAEDKYGRTAMDYLMETISYRDKLRVEETLALLEQHGAKPGAETLRECLVSSEGNLYAKMMLDKLQACGKQSGVSKALEYAVRGDDEKLQKEIRSGSVSKKEQKAVVLFCAANCNAETMKELVDAGYSLQAAEEKGGYIPENGEAQMKGPLEWAARYNDVDMVRYLLKESGQQWTKEQKENALTCAVSGEQKDTVKFLREKGIIWQRADFENTWITACAEGGSRSVEIMLQNEYEPTEEERICGYGECNQETFAALLKNRISFEGETDRGTALGIASRWNMAHAKKLFEKGAVPDCEACSNAVRSGETAFAKEMLLYITDLNSRGSEDSILDTAIRSGSMEMVQYLVNAGADVNYVYSDTDDSTPVHTAAAGPCREILEYMLENGGDTDIKDVWDKTPYDYAVEENMKENIEILQQNR